MSPFPPSFPLVFFGQQIIFLDDFGPGEVVVFLDCIVSKATDRTRRVPLLRVNNQPDRRLIGV